MQKILDLAKKYEQQMIEDRRRFHQNPELSNEEKETAAYVESELRKLGVEVKTGFAGYGLEGVIYGKNPNGKTILLRADMDALPIIEAVDVPFKSRNEGVMHACGHDCHTAGLLGAARILSELRDELDGNVKFCFQPAEEGDGGARVMVQQGIMENPHVDYAVGVHVDATHPVGSCCLEPGPISAYPNFFEYTITGRGAHGSVPHMSIDPIRPMMVIYEMVNGLRSEIDVLEPCVVQICKIQAGTAWAAIPTTAVIAGTTRTVTEQAQQHLKSRLEQIAKQIETLYPVKCEFVYKGTAKPVINTPAYVEPVRAVIADVYTKGTDRLRESKTGGEDFCFFGDSVPTTFIHAGCHNEDDSSTKYPIHNPQFNPDERVVALSAAALSSIAYAFVNGQLKPVE